MVWSIGGAAYPDFPFMSDASRAEKAGESTCAMAKKFDVGIELDQEGGDGKVDMIKSFVTGFRKNCPMGKYQISMDLTGGPSVTNDVWMVDGASDTMGLFLGLPPASFPAASAAGSVRWFLGRPAAPGPRWASTKEMRPSCASLRGPC